jgi:hypothetical protein
MPKKNKFQFPTSVSDFRLQDVSMFFLFFAGIIDASLQKFGFSLASSLPFRLLRLALALPPVVCLTPTPLRFSS